MSINIVKKPASEIDAGPLKQRVMGVDPSTHTGIVVFHGHMRIFNGVLEAPDGCIGYERLHSIATQVLTIATTLHVDYIFIERTITSGKFVNQIQGQIATAIRLYLHQNNCVWYDVSPTTLKKWATGSGKAKKKEMLQSVAVKWGFETKDDNEADAYLLARLGQHVISKGLLTKFKGVEPGNKE